MTSRERAVAALGGAPESVVYLIDSVMAAIDAAIAADRAARSQPLAPLSEEQLREMEERAHAWGDADEIGGVANILLRAYRGLEGTIGNLCEDATGQRVQQAVERKGWVRGIETVIGIIGDHTRPVMHREELVVCIRTRTGV